MTGPSRNDESADIAISGDRTSVCISKLDSSVWVVTCAAVFEDKLVVCKKSKQSGAIYATLFISSEQANFHQHVIPKFHGPPIAECILSTPPTPLKPPSPSPLQYRPLLKLVLPSSKLKPEGLCECIEPELFLQLFGSDCHIPTAAVLLVGSPNGHIRYCNLRNIMKKVTSSQFSNERKEETVSSNQHKFFQPLYSLDQPVMSVHAAVFTRRREQIDPSLFVDDLFSTSDAVPNSNSLIFLGQRGKVAISYAEDSISTTNSQKFARFVEYNVPGPILSSRLIPGQCMIYNSLRNLYRIDLRQECFKEAEENSPQLQLRRGPLLIPEASFKFPERVSISIPPSMLVDCKLLNADSDPDSMELEATIREVGLTFVTFSGDLHSLKTKACGEESVSHDPEVVAREIKRCLNSIKATNEEISTTSDAISKVNASLIELNHVLTLLCIIKCRQEGTPCLSGNQEAECPVKCSVSAGFKELGVSEREMCVDVRLSYHGKKTLGSGWSLLIQISPSSHESYDHLNSAYSLDSCKEIGTHLTTPTTTTFSRSMPLEGLANNGALAETVPVSFTQGPLCFSVSCYLCYDASNLITALDKDDTTVSCGHSVSILVNSRILDALDFTQRLLEAPKNLRQPLALATACLESKDNSLSSIDDRQTLLHSMQLPIQCELCGSLQQQNTDQAHMYRQLSNLLLPHIVGAEEQFQSGTEIRLTSYNSSSITLQLVKEKGSRQDTSTSRGLSLVIKSSSRSQLAEMVRCIDHKFHQQSGDTTSSATASKEKLFKREAELKEISQEAVAILNEVTTLEKFSREPLASKQDELISRTFSLYGKLRQLPHL